MPSKKKITRKEIKIMATKRKTSKKIETTADPVSEVNELTHEPVEETEEQDLIKPVEEVEVHQEPVIKQKPKQKTQRFNIGDIVYIKKDADSDLNGFKLFPQYKKYTYTVEDYNENTGVYTLRRLNLSLKLKEGLILAPSERAHDSLNRRQF
jgi:hypothetical protein